MDDLLNQRLECACLLCGDLYTNPKRLECGHVFCLQCLLERTGQTECPDPDCKRPIVPAEAEGIRRLRTEEEMADRVAALVREGVMPFGTSTQLKIYRDLHVAMTLGATHRSAMCDHCMTKGIDGALYKCGVCPDYDLCEACFELPRRQVHWAGHLFIKLKRRKTLPAPDTSSIKDGLAMGGSQDFTSRAHPGSRCDGCAAKPIVGTRFKCGMCDNYNLCEKCERNSVGIHDRNHVFIVLPHACADPPPGRQIPFEFFDTDLPWN